MAVDNHCVVALIARTRSSTMRTTWRRVMKKLIQILIVFGLVATMCGSTFGEVTKDGQHIPTIEKLFQDKVP